MKLRSDFVTNSSSSSYIILVDKLANDAINDLLIKRRLVKPQDWEGIEWALEILDHLDEVSFKDITAYYGELPDWMGEYFHSDFKDLEEEKGWWNTWKAIQVLEDTIKKHGDIKIGSYC